MTRILLTRHGHVEGLRPERFRGRAQLMLTSQGLADAEAVAARIAGSWKPTIVYTSPLERCVVTGGIIARTVGVKSVPLDGLMDIDYGTWQMRSHTEVEAEAPEAYRLWKTLPQRVRFPKGESLQELWSRTAEALRLVLERHSGETVVLVGHDSVNRAILMQLLEMPLSGYWRLTQDPCCLNLIEVSADSDARVHCINDTSHLG